MSSKFFAQPEQSHGGMGVDTDYRIVEREPLGQKKTIAVFLDKDDADQYVRWRNAALDESEMIALPAEEGNPVLDELKRAAAVVDSFPPWIKETMKLRLSPEER